MINYYEYETSPRKYEPQYEEKKADINQNIKTDYTILDTSTPITYNGSLLNRCNISLESVSCALSFDIYIENNKNEKFKTCVYLEIPYKHLDNSITDGSITVTQDTNFNFYRYE